MQIIFFLSILIVQCLLFCYDDENKKKDGFTMRNLKKCNRIVIKVGSSTLTHESGLLNIRRIEQLVKVLADIKNSGKQVILVSSGAQAVGFGRLGLKEKPKDMPGKQAIAAIGQCELMYIYDKLFSTYNHVTSQILLTKEDVDNPKRRNNLHNTFLRLLEIGALPIVNENDSVSTEEIEIGDNDTLSAIVATLTQADLLIVLSDIDGLYNDNPKTNPNATLIHHVKSISGAVESMAQGAGSNRGTGGMITKIQAAKIANQHGIDMVIMNGENPNLLYDLFENETIGTYFESTQSKEVEQ